MEKYKYPDLTNNSTIASQWKMVNELHRILYNNPIFSDDRSSGTPTVKYSIERLPEIVFTITDTLGDDVSSEDVRKVLENVQDYDPEGFKLIDDDIDIIVTAYEDDYIQVFKPTNNAIERKRELLRDVLDNGFEYDLTCDNSLGYIIDYLSSYIYYREQYVSTRNHSGYTNEYMTFCKIAGVDLMSDEYEDSKYNEYSYAMDWLTKAVCSLGDLYDANPDFYNDSDKELVCRCMLMFTITALTMRIYSTEIDCINDSDDITKVMPYYEYITLINPRCQLGIPFCGDELIRHDVQALYPIRDDLTLLSTYIVGLIDYFELMHDPNADFTVKDFISYKIPDEEFIQILSMILVNNNMDCSVLKVLLQTMYKENLEKYDKELQKYLSELNATDDEDTEEDYDEEDCEDDYDEDAVDYVASIGHILRDIQDLKESENYRLLGMLEFLESHIITFLEDEGYIGAEGEGIRALADILYTKNDEIAQRNKFGKLSIDLYTKMMTETVTTPDKVATLKCEWIPSLIKELMGIAIVELHDDAESIKDIDIKHIIDSDDTTSNTLFHVSGTLQYILFSMCAHMSLNCDPTTIVDRVNDELADGNTVSNLLDSIRNYIYKHYGNFDKFPRLKVLITRIANIVDVVERKDDLDAMDTEEDTEDDSMDDTMEDDIEENLLEKVDTEPLDKCKSWDDRMVLLCKTFYDLDNISYKEVKTREDRIKPLIPRLDVENIIQGLELLIGMKYNQNLGPIYDKESAYDPIVMHDMKCLLEDTTYGKWTPFDVMNLTIKVFREMSSDYDKYKKYNYVLPTMRELMEYVLSQCIAYECLALETEDDYIYFRELHSDIDGDNPIDDVTGICDINVKSFILELVQHMTPDRMTLITNLLEYCEMGIYISSTYNIPLEKLIGRANMQLKRSGVTLFDLLDVYDIFDDETIASKVASIRHSLDENNYVFKKEVPKYTKSDLLQLLVHKDASRWTMDDIRTISEIVVYLAGGDTDEAIREFLLTFSRRNPYLNAANSHSRITAPAHKKIFELITKSNIVGRKYNDMEDTNVIDEYKEFIHALKGILYLADASTVKFLRDTVTIIDLRNKYDIDNLLSIESINILDVIRDYTELCVSGHVDDTMSFDIKTELNRLIAGVLNIVCYLTNDISLAKVFSVTDMTYLLTLVDRTFNCSLADALQVIEDCVERCGLNTEYSKLPELIDTVHSGMDLQPKLFDVDMETYNIYIPVLDRKVDVLTSYSETLDKFIDLVAGFIDDKLITQEEIKKRTLRFVNDCDILSDAMDSLFVTNETDARGLLTIIYAFLYEPIDEALEIISGNDFVDTLVDLKRTMTLMHANIISITQ